MRERRLRAAAAALAPAIALGIGLGVGLGGAYAALSGEYLFGRVTAGPWIGWPRVGSREVDPYARALISRRGEIPLGLGEGLELRAATDDEGRELDGACAYRVSGRTPPARYWTLTLYDAEARPVRTALGRSGFTSAEILRRADSPLDVTLGPEAQPGNWLQTPPSGRLALVLRLYETPVPAGAVALDRASLPSLRRLGCGP